MKIAERLRRGKITRDSLRRASWKIVRESDFDEDLLFASLDRGAAILENEDQIAKYVTAFSAKHFYKFDVAMGAVRGVFAKRSISVVDWGCGAGLAEVAFADSKYGNACRKVRDIALVDPSQAALGWANFVASRCYEGAEIVAICKRFGELTDDDLRSLQSTASARIHIFSNVLDIQQVKRRSSFERFVKRFRDTVLKHGDLVVLMSPPIHNVDETFNCFRDIVGVVYRVRSVFSETVDEDDVKAQILIFRVSSCMSTLLRQRLNSAWKFILRLIGKGDS